MLKECKAYVDGSGTGDPDLLVLAGYIAPAAAWVEFSKEWQSRLHHAGLSRFKMSEMTSRMEVAGWFYRAIEESGIVGAISCAIYTAELVKVVRAFPWPPIVSPELSENPYFFAFKAITDVLAQHQHEFGIDEPVDFIFDDESEKVHLLRLNAWDMMKLSSAPEFRKNMGDDPVHKSDEKVLPLQAADLYAWWVRKWEAEQVADWGRLFPFPWGMQRDIRRLHVQFREKEFWEEFENACRPEALARWHIRDPARALKEVERRERGLPMTLPDPSSAWRF